MSPDLHVSRVLFDASNLTTGGGVQVAGSLIDEFLAAEKRPEVLSIYPWLRHVDFVVSPEVMDNLINTVDPNRIQVERKSPLTLRLGRRLRGHRYDVHYTVFGPRYGFRRAPCTVSGIADGTSVFKEEEGVIRARTAERITGWLRGVVSRRIFRGESYLVAESRALITEFCSRTRFAEERTTVIPNTVNRAVVDASSHQPLAINPRLGLGKGTLLFGYMARLYRHKNHDFLVRLHDELLELGIKSKFAVTLSDTEWVGAAPKFREACVNVGLLNISQVAAFNYACDAMVFPSLLEAFSATPLEALMCNGLLFASDREFVREGCGELPIYIDPLDASSAALVIKRTLREPEALAHRRTMAKQKASQLPDSAARASEYFRVLDSLLPPRRQ